MHTFKKINIAEWMFAAVERGGGVQCETVLSNMSEITQLLKLPRQRKNSN
jgi:hypothetical protein